MSEGSGRPRVLISAYACEPHRGSEPGVGWHWAVEAARDHEVRVLTWSKFREPIEAELRRNHYPNLSFVYYELPRWARLLARSERLHYVLWEAGILPLARRLQRQQQFDVVHHLTFNTIEVPGFLWLLDMPFVWGPVGGGQVPPAALKTYFGARWPIEVLRGLRKRFLRLNPFVGMATRRAACVLVSNRDTARLIEASLDNAAEAGKPRLRGASRREPRLRAETEIAVALPEAPVRQRDAGAPLEIVWAGLLVARKGPLLALDVAAVLKQRGVDFNLRMAGDGPWRAKVAARIEALGIEGQVSLLGPLSHAKMADFYAGGDVFLFTSLQDTNGTVVLEALSYGLPIVSLDHQGAAEMVTDECGIKVPVESQAQVIEALADGLMRLAGDRGLRERMSVAARDRIASRYTWEHKRAVIEAVYAQAMGREQNVNVTEGARQLVEVGHV